MQGKNNISSILTTIFSLAAIVLVCMPAKGNAVTHDNDAVFGSFRFHADANWANVSVDTTSEYRNPILPGTMPDPSICRRDSDYYIVNSSFCYFPALPIWHSRDLVHWENLGNVITRTSQLNLGTVDINSGVYAADIKFNPTNKFFYVIVDNVYSNGISIYVSNNPESGKWSDPVHPANVKGIDPSLLFDTDGTTYIVSSAGASSPDYDGENSIWLIEYDWQKRKTVGTPIEIVKGGYNVNNKPGALEGPHLYHINGKYYLMAAQGGIGPAHEEVIFKSDSSKGPFTECSHNPILTQKYLNSTTYSVTCAGHADLVETAEGNWYAVFLACRNYLASYCNTGRETFMLPAKWVDDQPVILDSPEKVPYKVSMSDEQKNLMKVNHINGYSFYDVNNLWDSQGLKDRSFVIRNPSDFYQVDNDGSLRISLRDIGLNEVKNPGLVLMRLPSPTFTITADYKFQPLAISDSAGIVFYLTDKHYIEMCKKIDASGDQVLSLGSYDTAFKNLYQVTVPDSCKDKRLFVKVESKSGNKYNFYYSYDGSSYRLLGAADATLLSGSHVWCFTGVSVGVFGAGIARNAPTNQIVNVDKSQKEKYSDIYDICGRALNKITRNGMYIIHGKKVIVTKFNL